MKLFLLCLFVLLSFGCQTSKPKVEQELKQPVVDFDFDKIKARGKLIALTRYSANTYFLYKGELMGFDYELLKRFCEAHNLELELKVPNNWNDLVPMLLNGEGDVIAAGMTVTKKRQTDIKFTTHLTTTRQVLIQRLPENWLQYKRHELEKILIRNQIDLINKTVHVRASSSYHSRLINLSDEIGGDINITFVADSIETEDLIRQVSEGEIEFTVADENIAKLNKSYFNNIDTETPVSFPQRISWGVRPNSDSLLVVLNKWIRKMKYSTDPTFNVIYGKYYTNEKTISRRLASDYLYKRSGKISKYDPLIKKYAQKIEWDWRLLASQIKQESEFNPKRKSWAGATGLMQVMPNTGQHYGVKNLIDPEKNLHVGTDFLEWLIDYWKDISDPDERLKFVLASYNVGQGHVQDARRLAEKFGKNPDRWEGHVDEYLLKKSKRKYFQEDVVYYGYCRGEEPYNYVKEILTRFEVYKQFTQT